MVGHQLDDSKSLQKNWLEITISIHLKKMGCSGYQGCTALNWDAQGNKNDLTWSSFGWKDAADWQELRKRMGVQSSDWNGFLGKVARDGENTTFGGPPKVGSFLVSGNPRKISGKSRLVKYYCNLARWMFLSAMNLFEPSQENPPTRLTEPILIECVFFPIDSNSYLDWKLPFSQLKKGNVS